MSKSSIKLYDSTLRDGAQTKGVNFSLDDKFKFYKLLSDIGVDCTEFVGGSKLIDSGGTMSLHSEKQDIETSCGTDPYVCDFHEELKTEWDKIDALNE